MRAPNGAATIAIWRKKERKRLVTIMPALVTKTDPLTFKLPFDNIERSIQAIKKGLPISTINKLQTVLDLSNIEVAKIAQVAPRTLLRRKQ
ncbi:hypothetical protein K8I31_18720, partial [bacterium]|nr:hypothetical protein [bacterium]